MQSNHLIFPVKIDLASALHEAESDALKFGRKFESICKKLLDFSNNHTFVEDFKQSLNDIIETLSGIYSIDNNKMHNLFIRDSESIDDYFADIRKCIIDTEKKLDRFRWQLNDRVERGIVDETKELEDRISEGQNLAHMLTSLLKVSPHFELSDNQFFSSKIVSINESLRVFLSMIRKVNSLKTNGLSYESFELVKSEYEDTLNSVNKLFERYNLEIQSPTTFQSVEDVKNAYIQLLDYLKLQPNAKLSYIHFNRVFENVEEDKILSWAKDLEKAKEYADKRIELAQYTADQIAEIEAKQRALDPAAASYKAQKAAYEQMVRGYRERERSEAAKLDYEQVKEQIGMFDDLGVRIGAAFEQILADLRAYTQSPDFARLSLEAQKSVYAQIAKVEHRMAEGFAGIGIGSVSAYVRDYSVAASEYLAAQNELKAATLAAIEADRRYSDAKKSGNQATVDAALAEKQLADSRVASATAAVNAAGANLQRTQANAARASERFNANLQKVESSLQSLNGGGLRALWDLIGDAGKQSVGEFLSGAKRLGTAAKQMRKQLDQGAISISGLTDNITKGLGEAMQGVDTSDLAATTEGLKNGLVEGFKASGASEELAKAMTEGMGEAVDATAKAITSGVESAAKATGELAETAANSTGALVKGVGDAASKTGEMWGAIISLVLSLLDEFAENGLGTFLGEIIEGVGDAVEGILANLLTDTVPKIIASVGSLLKGVGQGLGDLLTFGAFDFSYSRRVKKANKEIERQQELLDQLEYQYGRLEKAMESAFGADYISNHRARLAALQAQQQAYIAQAAAERSKGKKADEDKVKEYEQQARAAADSISDLLSDVSARMFGSDLASTAREFARSWLDAYKEFSSTADAIAEKFRDMMESMIVESLLGRVMQQALSPVFSMIDSMGADDFYSEDFWRRVAAAGETAMDQAEAGAQSVMRFLQGAGVSVTATAGELRGISREVAEASEESVTGLTAALNTQNHYVSHLPGIAANVAAMRALLESGGGAMGAGAAAPAVDVTALWTRHLELQGGIYDHTLRTARQCEAMAEKCAAMAADIHSVMSAPGSRATKVVNVAVR